LPAEGKFAAFDFTELRHVRWQLNDDPTTPHRVEPAIIARPFSFFRRAHDQIDGNVAWPTAEQVDHVVRPPSNPSGVNHGAPT
jgi:hypothetical protein